MLKLTILGAGTDASKLPGIPNRYPPGYLLEWDKAKLLFECSEGIRFRLEEVGLDYKDIHHLAISHSHPDHYVLAQYYQSVHNSLLWSGRYEEENELSIYCPKYISENFWQLWRLHQPNFPNGLKTPKLKFFSMPDSGKIALDGAKLSAALVYHGQGKVQAVAYRLEFQDKIFTYSGDTGMCEGIKEVAKNADLFICEASARIGDLKAATTYGHLSPRDVGEIAKAAGVKKVVLVHYTGLDSDEAMIDACRAAGYNGEIVVGKDSQVFEINQRRNFYGTT